MTDAIEQVFRLADRQVWIITAAGGTDGLSTRDARHGGLVATWVSKSSLDPRRPTLSIAIAANHFTRELIDASGAFAAHLITASQVDLAWRFGLGSGRDRDKLAGVAWSAGPTGSPRLADCRAWLDCRVYDRHDGGDRIYYWADVVAGAADGSGEPLTESRLIALADDAQKAQLRREMAADIDLQRPLLQARRARLEAERGE
jgi:flavin reductase (DIM6/NTAB) family NADH-FMN oxidoreductase RutF